MIRVFFLIFVFLTACQTNTDTKKNILRTAIQWDPTALHPHYAGIDLNCRTFQKCLYEGLTRIDARGEPTLAGAESVEINDDQTHFVFKIRPMTWSNGEAIRAHDFETSWKAAIAPTSVCLRADLFYVIKNAEKAKRNEISLDEVGVKALDEVHLEVTLEHPTPYFLDLVANPLFSPIAKEDREKRQPTLFNGPFVLKSWRNNDIFQMEKNERYWDAENVHLDGIEIQVIKDPNTALALYEKKELDWLGRPFLFLPADALSKLAESGELKEKEVSGVFWLCVNTEHPILKSAKIRRALSEAVPREEIASKVMHGMSPTWCVTPRHFALTLEQSSSLALAQKLFQEGMDELTLTSETFTPLTISCSDTVSYRKIAEILQQAWQNAFNIEITIDARDGSEFVHNLSTKNYQMGGLVWFSDFNDPIYNLDFFKDKKRTYNTTGWEDHEYQTLLDAADKEQNLEERWRHLQAAEHRLLEEMPIIPLYCDHFKYLVRPRVKNLVITDLGIVDFRWVRVE